MFWVASVDAESVVPTVRDWNEVWIGCCAQAGDNFGQRIFEVLIFATPETMSFHDHAAPEKFVVLKQCGCRLAFIAGEDVFDDRVAFCVEVL
jgi:hypothetical protein